MRACVELSACEKIEMIPIEQRFASQLGLNYQASGILSCSVMKIKIPVSQLLCDSLSDSLSRSAFSQKSHLLLGAGPNRSKTNGV